MFSNDSRSISSEEFNSVFPFTFITKVQHKITTFQCADSFPTRRKQVRLLQNDSLSRSKTVCENATKFYKKNIYSVYHGVLGGLSLPLEHLPSHMLFPPKLFKPQNSPHSSSFCRSHKIVDGGGNYTKIWGGKACR